MGHFKVRVLFKFLELLGRAFGQVGLVQNENKSATPVQCIPGDPQVLFGDSLICVDHQTGKVAFIQRLQSFYRGKGLYPKFDRRLSPQPGSVYYHTLATVDFTGSIDCVHSGSSHWGNDHTRLTQNFVYQAGFANVGATDDCQLKRLLGLFQQNLVQVRIFKGLLRDFFGEIASGVSEKILHTDIFLGRNHVKLLYAQLEKFSQHGFVFRTVDFIYRINRRHTFFAKNRGHVLIIRGQTVTPIHKQDHHVSQI